MESSGRTTSMTQPVRVAGWLTSQRPFGRPWPLHVALLPGVPVLALWSGNAREVYSLLPAWIAGWSITITLGLLIILTIVQRDLRRGALIASAVALQFGLHARIVPWQGVAGLVLASALLGIVVLAAARLPDRMLRSTTHLLNVMALALVLANLAVVVVNRPSTGTAVLPELVEVTPPSDAPDVWYIAPDRYPGLPVLERHGVETDEFAEALARRGFTTIENAHANYPETQVSLASAWNAQLLEVPHGASAPAHAVQLLKDPWIGRQFRAAGYAYLHVGTWFDSTSSSNSASQVLTLRLEPEVLRAWDQNTILPSVRSSTGAEWLYERDTRSVHVQHGRHQLETLQKLARRDAPDREFVLAHLTLPHRPYVFEADGKIRARVVTKREAYSGQLAYLNDQLLEIIDLLREREDPPIIILLPDEGLYPEDLDDETSSKDYDLGALTPSEIQEKLSITAAVYDPDISQRPQFAPGTTAVNVVRSVLNRALGTDLEPLPDQSYTWSRTPGGDLELVPADL